MKSVGVGVSFGLGLVVLGCTDVQGTIFADGSGSGSGSSTTAPQSTAAVDGASTGPCEPTVFLEGNDPIFEHGCGQPCDTDWCSCSACLVHSGGPRVLPFGLQQVRVLGGASGAVTYRFTIVESGRAEPLADEVIVYDGLFDHVVPFQVTSPCAAVELRIEQSTALCSRIYEIEYGPAS
ncbi:MAG: hypothetical protein K0V04_29820 [Deltaproteobacteria bacterium]|nr:hypothetical protein [Deltaproteobacteria bacterium]